MASTPSSSSSSSSSSLPTLTSMAAPSSSSSPSSNSHFSRRRPVSFGNPALGTYKGNVYTIPNSGVPPSSRSSSLLSPSLTKPLVEGAESVERMVAMIDVPPEHVPEGILSLVRSHRPFIEHVRIVIAEKDGEQTNRTGQDGDEEAEEDGAVPSKQREEGDSGSGLGGSSHPTNAKGGTYLVLFHMANESDAATFVDDLDGKPYIAFDDQDVCHVEHVVALQGQDGVSLLNPHFAASTRKPSSPGNGSALLDILSASDATTGSPALTSGDLPRSSSSSSSPSAKGLLTSTGYAENCAVCLEKMELYGADASTSNAGLAGGGEDTSKTAILTTVCNHTFHLDCLCQCSGPCPVCRYDHSGLNETLSQCHLCGTTEHNYVCLICGVVSCVGVPTMAGRAASVREAGRGETSGVTCSGTDGYAVAGGGNSRGSNQIGDASFVSGQVAVVGDNSSAASDGTAHRFYTSHAGQHYSDTLHAYALDTETQHVYDFAGQGYVHRLVQNKEDGKLVEINDPYSSSQERSLTPGLSDAQEGEVVHRKLEGFASQYYTLLKSQLEQQRTFYEGCLQEIRQEFATKERNHEKAKSELVTVLRQERKQLSHRLASLQRKRDKLLQDSAFLKSMNESLEANKPALQHRIQQAQRERIESRDMIQKYLPALEEKVTTLILQLEDSMESDSRSG